MLTYSLPAVLIINPDCVSLEAPGVAHTSLVDLNFPKTANKIEKQKGETIQLTIIKNMQRTQCLPRLPARPMQTAMQTATQPATQTATQTAAGRMQPMGLRPS